jgi:carbon-monoxide dehydrogenase large subunit
MSGSAIAWPPAAAKAQGAAGRRDALEAYPDDLEIVDGDGAVKGSRPGRIALRHGGRAVQPAALRVRRGLQARHPVHRRRLRQAAGGRGRRAGLEGRDYYTPSRSTFANGMHAAIVETDPRPPEIRILRYCVVHDCGRMINPMIVEGRSTAAWPRASAVRSTSGWHYDEHGQLLNASFMDFLMPYVTEVPDGSRSTTWRPRRR